MKKEHGSRMKHKEYDAKYTWSQKARIFLRVFKRFRYLYHMHSSGSREIET